MQENESEISLQIILYAVGRCNLISNAYKMAETMKFLGVYLHVNLFTNIW